MNTDPGTDATNSSGTVRRQRGRYNRIPEERLNASNRVPRVT